MAHRTARLNLFGRRLLVTRIAIDGWPVAKAAEAQGVSRTTAHKWIARYRAEGWPGLEDRSSRPHRSPRLTSPQQVEAILRARIERRWGPHRLAPLLGLPRSTVYAVLARAGYSRLRDADRLSGVPVR
jgi:transposase